MNKFEVIKANVVKVAGRGILITKKYSPEILTGVGVVGIVASTVMACKATLKVDEVLDDAQKKIEKIKYAEETIDKKDYSEQDYKKDLVIAYTQSGIGFVKLYGPSVTLGVASIACILGAHNIMRKRNVALIAAYKAVEGSFKDYRQRVVEEFGADKDRQFKYGIKNEEVTETEIGEDGKKHKVKSVVESVDVDHYSEYAKFFDEASPEWKKDSEMNLFFLKCQQNYVNDLLHARGHVFLNEVYDALGIPRTRAGAVVGWVMGNGDDNIDFGIYELNNERARDFVNGYERSILLDFNVDGVIYDLI